MKRTFIIMLMGAQFIVGDGKTLCAEDRMAWFDEARFGMFVHWGVYSVHGNVWKGKSYVDGGKNPAEWLMQRAQIPAGEYRTLARQFTASKYQPEAWARLAKEAGMKYVIIGAKHHDGFALYPTSVSDWNVSNTPAKKDLLLPLAEACRSMGLKFGVYYSQCQDWVNPGGAKRNPFFAKDGKRNMADGDGWDDSHKGSYDDYLRNIALPQVFEILSRYTPDIFWWDTPIDMTEARAKPFHDAVAKYPHIITNSRLGGPYKGDTKNPEQWVPPEGYPGERFEVCMTMNDTWGFALDDHRWKSTTMLLQVLSDTVSKGGNLLLNIGPKADGTIPAPALARLHEIADWMHVHGKAIHGTLASPYPRQLPWGRITRKQMPDGKEVFYLHIWEWPKDGKLVLPTIEQAPAQAVLLHSGKTVGTVLNKDGLLVQLNGTSPTNPHISVIELIFNTRVKVTAHAFLPADADGIFRLHARDADRYGNTAGVIEIKGSGDETVLSNWTVPAWHIKYRVQTIQKGRYKMNARISSYSASELKIGCGKENFSVAIPNTDGEWCEIDLGRISMPAGNNIIIMRTGKTWSPLEIGTVTLMAAPEQKKNDRSPILKSP